MTRTEIAAALRLTPRRGMEEAVRDHCAEDLGPEVCLYWRESSIMMEDEGCGWPEFEPEIKPRWAAHCHCSRCGNDWHSAWIKGGEGILLPMGEDGQTYIGIPDSEIDAIDISDGETFACPWCGEAVQLTRKQNLKSGRTYRIMIGSIENAGPYTAVIVWMAERWLSPEGEGFLSIVPKSAVVIDAGGGLMFFSCDGSKWRERKSTADPFQQIYNSYDGAMSRKAGAWLWPDVPEQLGQTGEKTGLTDYFRSGGQWPVMYLRFWQGHRNVENIVKAGWLHPFEASIDEEVLRMLRSGLEVGSGRKLFAPGDLECLAYWEAARPCDMLRMTKDEVRQGASWQWGADMLNLWMGCVDFRLAFPGDAALLNECKGRYGVGALQKWADMASEGNTPASLDRIDRYLEKQEKRGLGRRGALTMYLDYWEMLDADDPSLIQVFPPDLRAAHDRAVNCSRVAADEKYAMGFHKILKDWAALEWSDGEICAVLPRHNSDLVAEGKTLHHCVGGYGKTHVEGRLIVFIRHARRPERSWFTLNIDTTGKRWTEIQLHGYGNEFAHGKKLRIPERVRNFVDRWEREVLTPAFREVRAAEEKPEKKQRKERGAA